MFGKKKQPGIQVMHYEGIEGFATDYPCRLELDAEMLTITRIKPETTVTPQSHLQKFMKSGLKSTMQQLKIPMVTRQHSRPVNLSRT